MNRTDCSGDRMANHLYDNALPFQDQRDLSGHSSRDAITRTLSSAVSGEPVRPAPDLVTDVAKRRPIPTQRTTIKRRQQRESADVIYSNVADINTVNGDRKAGLDGNSQRETGDELPRLITELECILKDLNDNDYAQPRTGVEPLMPVETVSYSASPFSSSSSTYSSFSSSSCSLSGGRTSRPLPEPPKEVAPVKPPHLPPASPPPLLPPNSVSPPPLIPPRNLSSIRVVNSFDDNKQVDNKFSAKHEEEKTMTARKQFGDALEKCLQVKPHLAKSISPAVDLNSMRRSGYLWKTGADRKAFLERWCSLEISNDNLDDTHLSYYADRKSTVVKGKIALKEVSFVRRTPTASVKAKLPTVTDKTDKNTFSYFEVAVKSKKGRVYLFAAKCQADLDLWMRALTNAVAWTEWNTTIPFKDVENSGFLRLKRGISGEWQTSLVVLSGRTLTIINRDDGHDSAISDCDSLLDSRLAGLSYESHNIRKMMSIGYASVHQISSCPNVTELGQPVCLTLPQRVLYLQADFNSHTQLWYHSIMKSWSFGDITGKLEDQYLTKDNVPVAIDKCLNFISVYSTNLYSSVNYDSPTAKAILEALLSNAWSVQFKHNLHSVHDITAAMLMFLRQMSECLLTDKLYHSWIKVNELENRAERLDKLKQLLHWLPEVNYLTLKKIIAHLVHVIENGERNRSSILNISPVICSSILFVKMDHNIVANKLESESAGIDIVTDLILSYAWLFDVSSEELDKERKIQRAMQMLRESEQSDQSAKQSFPGKTLADCHEFLIGVYVYSKDWGQCLIVRVTPSMTALDLIDYTIKQAKLKETPETLAVFEIVCGEKLRRALHYSDIVLGVILEWVKWSQTESKENYLCVQPNNLIEHLMPHIGEQSAPTTIFSELKYADRSSKSFKKVLVEFIGAKLSLYKDAKAEKSLGQWNIEDITWYLGAESKRFSTDNQFAITFIEKNLPVIRTKDSPYFGRTICFNTEEEYYRWIAGMICAEYPNGLLPTKQQIDFLI